MGSSCFSRGNKKTVAFLQQYLKDRKLEDHVTLKGAHCMGHCEKGPVIKLDNDLFFYSDQQKLEALLDKAFNVKGA